jgi:hypothetical protein
VNNFTRQHVADIDPNRYGFDEVWDFSLEGDSLTLRGSNPAGVMVEAKFRRLKPRPILSWSVKPQE